jgi:hypothetical protein
MSVVVEHVLVSMYEAWGLIPSTNFRPTTRYYL